ncbi:hypothetical protein ACFLTX_01170 [Chloroflexota bacterium]
MEFGIDPYGDQATDRTQFLYYQGFINDDKDPLILDKAMAPLLLLFPLVVIDDYVLARFFYLLILELIIISIPLFISRFHNWKPNWLVVIFLVLTVGLLPVIVQSIITHDLIIFTIGLMTLGILCLKFNLDEFAGAAFAVVIFQPSLSGLLLAFVFWWIIRTRRWNVLWGFLMTSGLLFVISLVLIPGWIVGFVKAYRIESIYFNYLSSGTILTKINPVFGVKGSYLLTGAISIILLYEWIVLRAGDFRWFLWTCSLTICSIPLIGFPFHPNSSMIMVIPFINSYIMLSQRMTGNKKIIWQVIILASCFFTFWATYLYLINRQLFGVLNMVLFIIIPIILISSMYWIRWWVIKYPRMSIKHHE